ncbi:ABC transporter ATP-binding protein [Alkalihalobacillus trypoxylicola]|uniref:ABC transporter domain-containing protein n=1 Tax=Alkalihalobacillus trypoxylicola TaxID=519424 RepID=A0A162EL13_9BACI|nr:ABC transporter ATP-binding protein [Alkalihalobacillus trypoxylicola]KYG33154.1 hypothetical protein AZF04_17565 [Alkalihalobacillus trypoxylicola]
MLNVNNVTLKFGEHQVIRHIDFQVNRYEMFGIVGPNGSGKSTLLSAIHGGKPCDQGEIYLKNQKISSYSTKELAKLIAVLPQLSETAFDYKIKDIVALGRYPYQKGIFQQLSVHDHEMIEKVMKDTQIHSYKNQSLQTLSGGERQRVLLARALVQEPELLILDEPTNHLDMRHQIQLLDTLRAWTREHKITVIAVLHDLNLASLYFDRILLLDKGEKVELNHPNQTFNEKSLNEVYQTALRTFSHPQVSKPLITFVPSLDREETELHSVKSIIFEQKEKELRVISQNDWKFVSSEVGFFWSNTLSLKTEKEQNQQDHHKRVHHTEETSQKWLKTLQKTGHLQNQHFCFFVHLLVNNENISLKVWFFMEGHFCEADILKGFMRLSPIFEKHSEIELQSLVVGTNQKGDRVANFEELLVEIKSSAQSLMEEITEIRKEL